MTDIPHAVLSEHFQERMKGRRLVCAAFLTFKFDPAFFEQEVLPVFFDVPLSHVAAIRLLQLDDAIKQSTHLRSIAVYFDQNGLVAEGSAKLDIRRVAVRHSTGIFHPKNIFALVEDAEPDENGVRHRALLVACLSANLTRSGWWENVEACHVEEIREDQATRLRNDLRQFIGRLMNRLGAKAADDHVALRTIRGFLAETEQRAQRTTDGKLHTHFYAGGMSLPDFLESAAGSSLREMNLEILSPYFDVAATSTPLSELIERFAPRETRVYLPRSDSGEALCHAGLYDWVRQQAAVSWSRLPAEMTASGKSARAASRFVHAKVYRFFSQSHRREVIFVGSANLTASAHQNGGNEETGFLVDCSPSVRPEWWTATHNTRPTEFLPQREDDGLAAEGGTPLSLRYWWDRELAQAYWDGKKTAPALTVCSKGVAVLAIESLPGGKWVDLPKADAQRLAEILRSTSIFNVVVDGKETGSLLVQEEGMTHRPLLLLELTPQEILRYWALLTPEQRSAFIEARARDLTLNGEEAELITRLALSREEDSLFSRFAGIFHAFECMNREVREALEAKRDSAAVYRLFGQRYDSLGTLLGRIHEESQKDGADPIEHYVILLCARQVTEELRRAFPEFWKSRACDTRELQERISNLAHLRQRIEEREPGQMSTFLDWLEKWFLVRAQPLPSKEVA